MSSHPDFTTDADPEHNPGLAVRIAAGYLSNQPPRYQPPPQNAPQAAPEPPAKPTMAEAREALRAAGLHRLVARFRKVRGGRGIQVRGIADDTQTEKVYRLVGLMAEDGRR